MKRDYEHLEANLSCLVSRYSEDPEQAKQVFSSLFHEFLTGEIGKQLKHSLKERYESITPPSDEASKLFNVLSKKSDEKLIELMSELSAADRGREYGELGLTHLSAQLRRPLVLHLCDALFKPENSKLLDELVNYLIQSGMRSLDSNMTLRWEWTEELNDRAKEFLAKLQLAVAKDGVPDLDMNKEGPVMICGPTGSGKTLIAKLLADSLFESKLISLNIAAVTDSVLESRIRGHTKGAFTGANQQVKPIFASAHNGVLVFDELQSASRQSQTQLLDLLHSISDKVQVAPMGSHESSLYQVRTLFLVNEPLNELLNSNELRLDFLHRMRQIVTFPSLHERLNQKTKNLKLLPALISLMKLSFILNYSSDGHFSDISRAQLFDIIWNLKLEDEAEAQLRHYSWPGNLREFERLFTDLFHEQLLLDRKSNTIKLIKRSFFRDFALATEQQQAEAKGLGDENRLSEAESSDLNEVEHLKVKLVSDALRENNFVLKDTYEALKNYDVGLGHHKALKLFLLGYTAHFPEGIRHWINEKHVQNA